jgi:hypothetical protein
MAAIMNRSVINQDQLAPDNLEMVENFGETTIKSILVLTRDGNCTIPGR